MAKRFGPDTPFNVKEYVNCAAGALHLQVPVDLSKDVINVLNNRVAGDIGYWWFVW
jgi:hypothetical protein